MPSRTGRKAGRLRGTRLSEEAVASGMGGIVRGDTGRQRGETGLQAADGELRVPQAMRGQVGEILAITDRVCLEHLEGEYAELCRRLVAKLARKRPSPLARGALPTWAAGAIYA